MLKFIDKNRRALFTEDDEGKVEFHDKKLEEQMKTQLKIEEQVEAESKTNEGQAHNNLVEMSKPEIYSEHILLHQQFKNPPEGKTQDSIKKEHERVARVIIAKGYRHVIIDDLDQSIEDDLKLRSNKTPIDTLERLTLSHQKLHDNYPNGLNPAYINMAQEIHQQLVFTMLEHNISHAMIDNLDLTLSEDLVKIHFGENT